MNRLAVVLAVLTLTGSLSGCVGDGGDPGNAGTPSPRPDASSAPAKQAAGSDEFRAMSAPPAPDAPAFAATLVGGDDALLEGEPTPPPDAPLHLLLSNVGTRTDTYRIVVRDGPRDAVRPNRLTLTSGSVRPLRLSHPPGVEPRWTIEVRSSGSGRVVASWSPRQG